MGLVCGCHAEELLLLCGPEHAHVLPVARLAHGDAAAPLPQLIEEPRTSTEKILSRLLWGGLFASP